MEITITGRNTSISETMKKQAVDKLSRLSRHNDMLTRADVVMRVEGDRQMIEMVAHSRKGGPFVGKAEHTDMYAAVDLLVDKMERQVRRHKEKTKKPTGRQRVSDLVAKPQSEQVAEADDDEALGGE